MRWSLRLCVCGFVLSACTPKEPVEIGSSCSAAGKTEACAVDKLAVCTGGKWQETASCAQGCSRKSIGHGSTAPICEEALGRAGNVCTIASSRICSEDRHTQLVCDGGRWKAEKTCPTSCTFPKTGIVCQ